MESQQLQGRILLIRKRGGLDGENEKGNRDREVGERWERDGATERGEEETGGDESSEETGQN